jgi:hypothetical protein
LIELSIVSREFLGVGDWRVIYREGVVLRIVRIAPRGSAYE